MDGGNLPIYYKLEWYDEITDPLNPLWTEITSESDGILSTYTHTRTSPFTSGVNQKYRIKPKNLLGWGTVYSAELSVQADEVPISMSTVTVGTITPTTIDLSWSEITLATQTGRDAVTYYHV